MLTAVRNFLLTPTPPHPHIHLSNVTPLPTKNKPGSPSSRGNLHGDAPVSEPVTRRSRKATRHLLWSLFIRQEGLLLHCFPLSPVGGEEPWSMDLFHAMWESLLFPWLPVRQPLPSVLGALGSTTAGAHLMWSSHLTSSSPPQTQTEQTKRAADCCRPFTCKYRDRAWVWVQY